MCGIAGIYAYGGRASLPDLDELRRIRDRMRSRGPDGQGKWRSLDGRVILGHRRLSIIDLSERGAQPMSSADGRRVVSFNGEIYNYRELRRELEAQGRFFCSDSDTEVLLHLYDVLGERMIGRLRGMFAFALWDADRQGLFLARDALGIKPLYYADDGHTFRLASQVKALQAGGAISKERDLAGEAGFWLLGSVPEPYTIYRDIRALEAGCSLWIDGRGAQEPRRWFSLPQTLRERPEVEGPEGNEHTRAALLESVRAHLVADVPVGAFLSAGIDSGALVGLMRDAGQGEIHTLTLAFEKFRNSPDDEAPLAAAVARHYGTHHTVRYVDRAEFEADLPHILDAMDQPSIDGLNSWFVSKAAHEAGLKVAISGLGGDELFGGYPAFRDLPRWVGWFGGVPAPLGLLGRRLGQGLKKLGFNLNSKGISLAEYAGTYPGAWLIRRGLFMPWELPDLMGPEAARDGLARLAPLAHIASCLNPEPGTPFRRIAALETGLYMRNQLLRDTDWASMAHSLEVRVPLVDRTLISASMRTGKQVLSGAPRRPLPDSIARRPKTGFQTPIRSWLPRTARTKDSPGQHWSRLWAHEVFTHFANS